ncbi:interleukin-12 receptor subunit beta-2-like isoform X2 [Engystomops pustulosus]|uniref:interleukin-12 receptor subunit beta-2-like isoform X2 n=1 Tax=Engystomops pustulosus TaxID=76066 RepID=UPI003AFA8C5F
MQPARPSTSPSQLMDRRFWLLWMTVIISTMWIPMRSTAAEICPAAMMTASPGPVIHHGRPINLTCTLTGNAKHCNPGSREDVKIYRNKTSLPGIVRKGSVTVQDPQPPPGETVYFCWKCKTLCVMSVFAGVPPDQPRSITCEQEGERGKVLCSWDSGRETFLETSYTLQLWQQTHNVTISSQCRSQSDQSVLLPLSITAGGVYTVLVRTYNELGEKASLPYTFTYTDAVKPYPPDDIAVTCDTSHTCAVTIRTPQDVRHFQIRYRIMNERVWEQVQILDSRSWSLHRLRALSQYEFRAACKYVINGGKWSNWSKVVVHETPEEAPGDKTYVWYRLQGSNGEATIFWKYMNVSEFRGRIQFYQVMIQDNGRHGGHIENTTNTRLSRNIGSEGCDITVSAHNSMGSSPPTSIRVTTHSLSGLLKPYICYELYVYLLWDGRAGLPGKTQGSTPQIAPLTGPKFKYEIPRKNTILVTWQEIPVEARMGCITHYTIYVRATAQTTRIIQVSSDQSPYYRYEIDDVKRNVQYSLEMTCSNVAGESPPSPLISASIQPHVSEDTMVVVAFGVVLLCVGFALSISLAKRRMQLFLSGILPQWWSKPVPDPANCEWAKEYILNKEKTEFLTNVTASVSDFDDYDDTETLEVVEMTSDDDDDDGDDDDDDESSTAVFSYKLDIINTTQGESNMTSTDTETIKPAQDAGYRSLAPDDQDNRARTPSTYLLRHDMKSVEYLLHQDIQSSDNPTHQEIK